MQAHHDMPPARADAAAGATDDATLVKLMEAYQAGQLEAFERLYAALSGDIRRYFAAILRDHAAAADLVQETFLEMHRSRHTYAPPLPVRPWIFGIARHVRWRHRRSTMRRAQYESLTLDSTASATAAATTSAAAAASATVASNRHDIEDAILRLPPTRREVWLLHHVHGFSFQEIADRLRIGVGAAKLRSSRAMRTLRDWLGDQRGPRGEGGRHE